MAVHVRFNLYVPLVEWTTVTVTQDVRVELFDPRVSACLHFSTLDEAEVYFSKVLECIQADYEKPLPAALREQEGQP